MEQMQVFNNEQFGEVRTVLKDGEPWFVAIDVCEALGLSQVTRAMSRLDADEGGLLEVTHPQNKDKTIEVNGVSESGLYHLILCSKKPEAKAFKRWITHDVIPAIRKHGGYLTPQKIEEALSDPDTIIRLATQLKEERAKRAELVTKIEEDKPFTDFGKAISASPASILLGDFAKLAANNGIAIGRNRLFKWLRDNKYLTPDNKPYQRYVDQGVFSVKESRVVTGNAEIIKTTTLVTGKGQQYLMSRLEPVG